MADVDSIISILEQVGIDRTVPRNVRAAVVKAKEDMANEKLDIDFRVSSAISILDEIAADVNLPPYSRTQIWNAVSSLETLANQLKQKK
jgi:uncharacterized protein (UPF0147 family)